MMCQGCKLIRLFFFNEFILALIIKIISDSYLHFNLYCGSPSISFLSKLPAGPVIPVLVAVIP